MSRRGLFVFASLVAIVVLGAFGLTAPASADSADIGIDHNGGAAGINSGPAFVVEGGSATVGLVAVAPPSELGAWEVNVSYDASLLDPTACTAFGFGGGAVCNPDYPPNIVRVVGADATRGKWDGKAR
jgi:hypothetical protein